VISVGFYSAASSLVTPAELRRTFPDLVDEERVSGFITGILYTAFFSVCPQIFKILSNFGSGATSVQHAETSALRYYWIFMLATAFTGTSLATIIIEGVYYNFNVAEEARDVLRLVASTIPTTVGSTWLNWLIIRYSVTLPTNYLLQFPTLAWRAIHFKCCSRMTAGGGPGGPMVSAVDGLPVHFRSKIHSGRF
jgi:Calcium-dependent channel, 7TM region, putative phosphate